jgi:hypothetical protein
VGQTLDANQHNNLKLPSGSTIGLTTTEDLRRQLARLGIEGAHTRPKNEIVSAYVATLKRIHDDAGSAAVDAWLEQHKV